MVDMIYVRIAVAVDPGGEWNANGWGGRDRPYDEEAMFMAVESVGTNAARYWIETELPIPGAGASGDHHVRLARIDPDVAEAFPDSAAVNDALRKLIVDRSR